MTRISFKLFGFNLDSDYPFGIFTDSDYPFSIFMDSDYPFGIFMDFDYPFGIFMNYLASIFRLSPYMLKVILETCSVQ
jgi:hypothetical protein